MQRKSTIDIQLDLQAIPPAEQATSAPPAAPVSVAAAPAPSAAPSASSPVAASVAPESSKEKETDNDRDATPAAAAVALSSTTAESGRTNVAQPEDIELKASSEEVTTVPAIEEHGVPRKSCCSIL